MIEQARKVTFKGKEYDRYHGSPFDRGTADCYYERAEDPHKRAWDYVTGYTYITDLTKEETEAYYAGYEYAEAMGFKKEWRDDSY